MDLAPAAITGHSLLGKFYHRPVKGPNTDGFSETPLDNSIFVELFLGGWFFEE